MALMFVEFARRYEWTRGAPPIHITFACSGVVMDQSAIGLGPPLRSSNEFLPGFFRSSPVNRHRPDESPELDTLCSILEGLFGCES